MIAFSYILVYLHFWVLIKYSMIRGIIKHFISNYTGFVSIKNWNSAVTEPALLHYTTDVGFQTNSYTTWSHIETICAHKK
jgi:hypothetical protein